MRGRALSSVVLWLGTALLACAAGDATNPASPHADATPTLDATGGTGGKAGSTGGGGASAAGGATEAGTGGADSAVGAASGTGGGTGGADGSVGSGGSLVDASSDAPNDPRGTYSLACTGDAGSQVTVAKATELDIFGDWTIETWFKDEGPSGGQQFDHGRMAMITKGDPQLAPYLLLTEWRTIKAGHKLVLEAGPWLEEMAEFDMNANGYKNASWIHAAATFTATTRAVQIYLNGELKTVTGSPLANAYNQPSKSLVFCSLSGQAYWKGKLDDIRVWKIVRSASEIQDNYKTQLPKPVTGLVANWTFDEGAGTIAHDNTGNEYHGTLQGTASFSTDIHP
jgi:hypothetical protein